MNVFFFCDYGENKYKKYAHSTDTAMDQYNAVVVGHAFVFLAVARFIKCASCHPTIIYRTIIAKYRGYRMSFCFGKTLLLNRIIYQNRLRRRVYPRTTEESINVWGGTDELLAARPRPVTEIRTIRCSIPILVYRVAFITYTGCCIYFVLKTNFFSISQHPRSSYRPGEKVIQIPHDRAFYEVWQ